MVVAVVMVAVVVRARGSFFRVLLGRDLRGRVRGRSGMCRGLWESGRRGRRGEGAFWSVVPLYFQFIVLLAWSGRLVDAARLNVRRRG